MKRTIGLGLVAMFTLGVATAPVSQADPPFHYEDTLEVPCHFEDFHISITIKTTGGDMPEWEGGWLSTTSATGTATGLESGTTWKYHFLNVDFGVAPAGGPELGYEGGASRTLLKRTEGPAHPTRISLLGASVPYFGDGHGELYCTAWSGIVSSVSERRRG